MRCWILIGVAFSMTGCLGWLNLGHRLQGEREWRVEEAIEAYNANLRWGRTEVAVKRVSPAARAAFIEFLNDESVSVQFTGYDVGSIEHGSDRDRVEVWVSFQLYRPPSLHERTVVEHQIWSYDHESRRWYLTPDLGLYESGVATRVSSDR